MTNSPKSSRQEAAELLQKRRSARRSLIAWAEVCGYTPALHHRLLLRNLELVATGAIKRLIILMPPGSAKSTYTSILFPPWYLCINPRSTILACSHAKELIEGFGRKCRNLVDLHQSTLGYALKQDKQAADDWETSLGGVYFCAGVGAGIAGHRAGLGAIDDYLGSQEDADSKTVRDKQWAWYWNDFVPRLVPGAPQVIVANRRHEDDLVGRLLQMMGHQWTVIRLPMLAEENDPLGRKPGDRLWPEYFTAEMVETARAIPRVWAGLYQQRPAPEEGDYFKNAWLVGYEPQDLPKDLRIYAAGDFAVSEEEYANATCVGAAGVDSAGVIWLLPDIYWDHVKRDPPDTKIERMIDLFERQHPLTVWGERGHITKALKPFINMRMRERHAYTYIEEITPTKAKDVRARCIQARMAQGMVRFPKFAPWWPDAEHELLTFPGGKSDDFVDMLAHLGSGIDKMVRPAIATVEKPFNLLEMTPRALTWGAFKRNIKRRDRRLALAREDL